MLLVLSKPSEETPEDTQILRTDSCESSHTGDVGLHNNEQDQYYVMPRLKEGEEVTKKGSSFLIFVICDGGHLLIVVSFEIFIALFICHCLSVSLLAVPCNVNPRALPTTKRTAPKVIFRHGVSMEKAHM